MDEELYHRKIFFVYLLDDEVYRVFDIIPRGHIFLVGEKNWQGVLMTGGWPHNYEILNVRQRKREE